MLHFFNNIFFFFCTVYDHTIANVFVIAAVTRGATVVLLFQCCFTFDLPLQHFVALATLSHYCCCSNVKDFYLVKFFLMQHLALRTALYICLTQEGSEFKAQRNDISHVAPLESCELCVCVYLYIWPNNDYSVFLCCCLIKEYFCVPIVLPLLIKILEIFVLIFVLMQFIQHILWSKYSTWLST